MVTFESKITKNGCNTMLQCQRQKRGTDAAQQSVDITSKVSRQLREILGLDEGEKVTVTLDGLNSNMLDELKIPTDILAEAGIPEDCPLEVYVDGGRVVIQEAIDG